MWFAGLAVGLVVGALSQSTALMLVLGALGACVGYVASRVEGARLSAQPDDDAGKYVEADASPHVASGDALQPTADDMLLTTLQHRVAALERRVHELEQTRAGAASAHVVAAGREAQQNDPPAVFLTGAPAVAAVPEALRAAHIDVDINSNAPLVTGTAARTAMSSRQIEPDVASVSAPESLSSTDAPEPPPSPNAVSWTDTLPQSMFPPASAPRSSNARDWAEPPPALSLRERLPAPLAQLIFGGNTVVKLGVLILFLGLAFLLRYTAERVTVPIEVRYIGVALVGVALLALGWWQRHRSSAYGLILQGAGVGVFYLTTLAAMKLHPLITPAVGFGLLFSVAVFGAALAVLQDASVMAVIAVLEGFAAPVLASTGSNQPVGLFTYLLALDVGIFLIAWFKAWRLLNLIGLVCTFALAAAWAERYYTDAQYAIVQPYLVVFFVLFALIGVLFARRTLFDAPADDTLPLAERAAETLRRVGRVDSALVFGAPLAAFGMQYLLMRPWHYGAAFSALGFAAFYLALSRFIFATQPRGLALLAEAYAIVGVIFATLSIPLGLEGEWTSATWAVEAAGMYWLGVRQSRPYARAFAFVVLAGATVQLLRGITIVYAHTDALIGASTGPLLHGSIIGPLMLAVSVFAVWRLWLRHQPDDGGDWEALAGGALPWLGMAALVLLPWQSFTPMWAAAATALLASAAYAVSVRFDLPHLRSVVLAMQLLAVVAFIATLHRGEVGAAALGNGWKGMLAAVLIGLSMLATTVGSMRMAHRAALDSGVQPAWSVAQSLALLAAVGLLHLAMLFAIDLPQAALIWPFTAAVVSWVALRIGHPPLAAMGAALHVTAAMLFVFAPPAISADLAAFANLGFWTPLALGVTAFVVGDWLRGEATRAASSSAAAVKQGINRWCAQPAVLWLPIVWGLLWWVDAIGGESERVLRVHGATAYLPASMLALTVATSVLANVIASWRGWSQLGQATLATLPCFAIEGLFVVARSIHADPSTVHLPSSALGWAAWPLALVWHLLLLRAQPRWIAPRTLAYFHAAGVWLFVLVAARECQARLGDLGDAYASGPLLGWVLVPLLAVWALRCSALLARWPLTAHRRAYLEWALTPLAFYLFGWCWLSNVVGTGDAASLPLLSMLPFVPVLNPLELVQWLALAVLLLWCKSVEGSDALTLDADLVKGVAVVTAWALVTGSVLRACHHYAGVPWQAAALYASWLTQAALSITWALCGVAAMVVGGGKGTRAVWLAGAVLIGVVVVKLFFVELANQGGLFRIVSFIAVGALLLLVGYFAPVPPARPVLREASAE